MEFREIEDTDTVYPGEYLLHKPSRQIVVCGAYIKKEEKIKALANGRLLVGEIADFQKVLVNKDDQGKKRTFSRCKGCSS